MPGDGIPQSLHPAVVRRRLRNPVLPDDTSAKACAPVCWPSTFRRAHPLRHRHRCTTTPACGFWGCAMWCTCARVHWRAGADWLVAHLLDGDHGPANHLSWQWVAGTGLQALLGSTRRTCPPAPAHWHNPVGSTPRTKRWTRSHRGGRSATGSAACCWNATGWRATPHRSPPWVPPLHRRACYRCRCPTPPRPASSAGATMVAGAPVALRAPPADGPNDSHRSACTCANTMRLALARNARWHFGSTPPCACGATALVDGGCGRAGLHSWPGPPQCAAWTTCTSGDGCSQSLNWNAAPAWFLPVERICTSYSQWWSRATVA